MDAQVSMQRMPPVSPGLSEAQSLAIVQIFLNASLACIAHTRELIPWTSPCFHTRYIDQLGFDTRDDTGIYHKFCNTAVQANTSDKSQELRVLARGKDDKADSILDLLELGVLEALQDGLLEAFSVFITTDRRDPTKVLEAYTFSFIYDQARLSRISVSSRSKFVFTIMDACKSFKTAIRTLLRSLQDLPRLPRHRSLGMSLVYNQQCPKEFEPTGFINAQTFPTVGSASWAVLWENQPRSAATFNAGKHSVAVATQTLRWSENLTWTQMQDNRAKTQLKFMQHTSSRDEQLAPTLTGAYPSQGKVCVAERVDSTACDQLITSHAVRGKNGLADLDVKSKNRRRRNVVPSKIAEAVVQAQALEDDNAEELRIFDEGMLAQGQIRRVATPTLVRCECNSKHNAEDMLVCHLCNSLQHKRCYGYGTLRAGSLPDEHFCYNCLLLPREEKLNNSMPGVVGMRLALLALAQQNSSVVKVDNNFVRSIFLDSTESATDFFGLMDRLVTEQFLGREPDSCIHIIADSAKAEEARERYLDPLAGIMHHYDIARDGYKPEHRKVDIRQALRTYTSNRTGTLSNATHAIPDRVHLKDNKGRDVVRWGFYANWKRKRSTVLAGTRKQRKISMSNHFVDIDRSGSSDTYRLTDGLVEAANETEWDMRLDCRVTSVSGLSQ